VRVFRVRGFRVRLFYTIDFSILKRGFVKLLSTSFGLYIFSTQPLLGHNCLGP
jgi:hypothetical protein